MGNRASSNMTLKELVTQATFEQDGVTLQHNGQSKVRLSSWWREKKENKKRHIGAGRHSPGGPIELIEFSTGCACEWKIQSIDQHRRLFDFVIPEGQITTFECRILNDVHRRYLSVNGDGHLCLDASNTSDDSKWTLNIVQGGDIFTMTNKNRHVVLNGVDDNLVAVLKDFEDDDVETKRSFYFELV